MPETHEQVHELNAAEISEISKIVERVSKAQDALNIIADQKLDETTERKLDRASICLGDAQSILLGLQQHLRGVENAKALK